MSVCTAPIAVPKVGAKWSSATRSKAMLGDTVRLVCGDFAYVSHVAASLAWPLRVSLVKASRSPNLSRTYSDSGQPAQSVYDIADRIGSSVQTSRPREFDNASDWPAARASRWGLRRDGFGSKFALKIVICNAFLDVQH